jgi:PAS domain S-box-containing protein
MSKGKILIVEDESIEALDIKHVLESFGYEVPYTATSGEEAVELALDSKPDLILMDIILKGNTDGIDAAAKIKELNIPVIYLTAYSEEFEVSRALLTEPYGYITKPFDRNELKYTIELAIYKNKMKLELKISEEKYRRLAENSKDMIYRMSIPDGHYQYVNPAAEEITEFSPEEFYKSTRLLKSCIHPDHRNYYNKTWKKLLNGETHSTYEYKIITKSGKEKWLNQRNTIIKDNEGSPIAIEGTVTDITKRKEAEEELKKREMDFNIENKKLLRAQKVAKIGIWENDLSTNDLLWSEEMYRIMGFEPNTPVNLVDVTKVFPPKEFKRFQQAVDAAINKNSPYSIDYKIKKQDGTLIYIHDEGEIIRNNEGKPISMFGTTQDITERKLAEKSLKESESKFRNLVETTPDMIWEIDTQGIFTYISPQSNSILGWSPLEIIGKSIFSLIRQEYIPKIKKSFQTHIEGTKKFNILEVPAKHRNGKYIVIEIHSAKLVNDNGEIKGFQGIARDITEKTIATNKLKTSIKEKDILLQEIHHRVKNNMQIISSLLNLQIKHIKDDEAIDVLKESQNRVKTMAMIHEKLYQSNDFTRINITEYIENLINGLFYSYSIDQDEILSVINVDDVRLNIETAVPCGLIINELVSNSLKHGFPNRTKGQVYISLKFIDDKYELIIGDNGIGLPSNIDFKKTDSLGLQLVNNLVEQIDGEIELNKRSGTEFKIMFNELKYKSRI